MNTNGRSVNVSASAALLLASLWIALSVIPATATEHVYYFHNDHLGTPQAMSDASGRKVWEAEYEPFGKAAVNHDPDVDGQIVVNNLRFPGQYYDAETGLHYNYHRDYDPATGRYLQPDPIGLEGGPNLYSYVQNNPLVFIDPDGLMKLPGAPGELPPGWTPDPSHHDPNGERWRGPSGDYVDWHKGQPGKPGWGGKDHWHHNGGKEHLPPGADIPDPNPEPLACDSGCSQKVATVVMGSAGAYIAYRCVRLIPSLFPPLWPTLPLNAVAP